MRPDTYALDLEVETRGIPDSWRLSDYSLTMRNWPAFTETDRKTDERHVRVSSLVGRNLHRDHSQGLVKGPKSYEGTVEWAAVQSRYFLCATAVEQAIPRGAAGRGEELPLTDAETPPARPQREARAARWGSAAWSWGCRPRRGPAVLVYVGRATCACCRAWEVFFFFFFFIKKKKKKSPSSASWSTWARATCACCRAWATT